MSDKPTGAISNPDAYEHEHVTLANIENLLDAMEARIMARIDELADGMPTDPTNLVGGEKAGAL